MQRRIEAKWRPSLALVLACMIGVVLCLPLAGIAVVKLVSPYSRVSEAVLLTAIPVIVIAAGVGWVLRRILLRPITSLAARADDIRTGKAEALDPLEHYGTSEMVVLGQAMREMGMVLKGREIVLRSYADHVTHELKSPLSAIRGGAELLADDTLSPLDRAKLVSNVSIAAERIEDLLDDQRDFARAIEMTHRGQCRLSEVLRNHAAAVVARDGVIPLHPDVMDVVVTQLMGNALENGASQVRFDLENRVLTVSDDGPGISPGNRERVFDPFFTTRRDAGGTGMGLAIVRRMLEAQGATITLIDGDGATFEIAF